VDVNFASSCEEIAKNVYWASTTSASVAAISQATLIFPAAATSSIGPSVWINVNTIQVLWTTSLFGSKQNSYSKNCFNDNYHPFSINYGFSKSVSNYFYTESFSDNWRRSLSEVYVEEDEIINWFTSYGMDSVMFLYVLIYKSVLIALIACFIFLCYVFIRICLFVLPERKWLENIRDFFSYAMFWNIPFRYF